MGINWKRKFIHLSTSLFFFLLAKNLSFNTFQLILILFLLTVLVVEFIRLIFPEQLPYKKFLTSLLKEREKKKLSDATFFLSGVLFANLLISGKPLEFLILVLGISDFLAGLIGGLYGKPFLNFNKSLLGAISFFLSSLVIGFFYLEISTINLILLCLSMTLSEFFTVRDNLWIPLSGALYFKLFYYTI